MTQAYPTMPIRIRGVDFPSARAAAEHFGIRPSSVYAAVACGKADTIGIGRGRHGMKKPGRNPRPVVIGGVRYPSMSEASVALGFNRGYVEKAFRVGRAVSKERILAAAMALRAREAAEARKARRA